MVDWTIERYDGYIATSDVSTHPILTIDTSDINDVTNYFVVELEVVVLSIKKGLSEGGAATRTISFINWDGYVWRVTGATLVRVGTEAVDVISWSSPSFTPLLTLLIQAHDTDPTQHQAIVTARVFESEDNP